MLFILNSNFIFNLIKCNFLFGYLTYNTYVGTNKRGITYTKYYVGITFITSLMAFVIKDFLVFNLYVVNYLYHVLLYDCKTIFVIQHHAI